MLSKKQFESYFVIWWFSLSYVLYLILAKIVEMLDCIIRESLDCMIRSFYLTWGTSICQHELPNQSFQFIYFLMHLLLYEVTIFFCSDLALYICYMKLKFDGILLTFICYFQIQTLTYLTNGKSLDAFVSSTCQSTIVRRRIKWVEKNDCDEFPRLAFREIKVIFP